MVKALRHRLPWVASALAASVSAVFAGHAAATPSVTYILSPNDDGQGNFSPGQFAVYAVDSTGDNAGIAGYSFDIQGFTSLANVAPQAVYNGPGTNSVKAGFALVGRSPDNVDPVRGAQDNSATLDTTVLVYGFGQVGGNLNQYAPAGSTGTNIIQPVYDAKLLLATGTFSNPAALKFNADHSLDRGNVFRNATAGDTSAAFVNPVAALVDTYIGPTGSWSSAANWSPAVPLLYDTALITGTSGAVVVTYDASASAATLGSLTIDGTAGATRTLSQTANTLSTAHEFVGLNGVGILSISGGTHTVTGSGSNGLSIGVNAASNGTVNLSAGALNVNFNETVGSAGQALVSQTGGTHTIGGTLAIGTLGAYNLAGGNLSAATTVNNGSITQTGGTATLSPISGNGSLVVGGGTGSASLNATRFSQSSVSVGANSKLSLVQNASFGQPANAAASLSISNGGILDLNNQTLVTSTPAATVRQYLVNGYSNGNWNGTSGGGITSTWAANDPTKRTGLGYVIQPDGTSLVAATLYGDTTLKGSVGLSDYNTLASNFNKPGVWSQGDFNYDGTVGLTDYNLLAANFNKSAQPGGGVAVAGAGGAAKAAVATLTGSASPAGQSTLPANVVDPGSGKVALEADPSTGKIYIVGHDSNINSYEVDSAAGKLTFVSQKNSGGYNTLTAQSATVAIPGSNNPAEDSWAIISSQAGTFVAEAYPASDNPAYDIVGPGLQVFDLNKSGVSAWTAGTPVSDLSFKYGNGTGATLTPAVIALGSGVPEPTCLALAGIAAGGLLSRRRARCKVLSA